MTYPNFNYYQPAYGGSDPLAPARRASILMYVLGGIMILSAFCCAGVGAVLPKLMEEQPELAEAMRSVPDATPRLMQMAFMVMAGMSIMAGIVVVILARFVARGGRGAIITSIVLSCLLGLFLLINLARALVTPVPQRGGAVCMMVVPLGMLGLLLAWLFQAVRAGPQASQMNAQYAAQYWQYYQQQQQAAQGPYAPPMPMMPQQAPPQQLTPQQQPPQQQPQSPPPPTSA